MYLKSTAYADGAPIPARYATTKVEGGHGTSVPLVWGDEPDGTRSFVVEMIDHHPVAHGWVHWLIVGLPSGVHEIAEDASGTSAMPVGALELPNTGGRAGYGGPQPPVGSGVHDYEITLSALDVARLPVRADGTLADVRAAMYGHVMEQAVLVGRFGR
jgi:Raf kinase inhibitor-like YbhB/YbcL family protein